jgi:hypothetical protein
MAEMPHIFLPAKNLRSPVEEQDVQGTEDGGDRSAGDAEHAEHPRTALNPPHFGRMTSSIQKRCSRFHCDGSASLEIQQQGQVEGL